MQETKRVLLLGASGMIGQEIVKAAAAESRLVLVPASHRQISGFVQIAFSSLTSADAWRSVLENLGINAVINCVGIWSGSIEEFELVQFTVPVALFNACRQADITIIHVSALGFTPDSELPYASTKARADRYLIEHIPGAIVVYPSLVFGSDGKSSQFFLKLAALPICIDFGFPANIQPVHVREVAQSVVDALVGRNAGPVLECAGRHAISIPDYLEKLRTGMGIRSRPLRLYLPSWLGKICFHTGEILGARFVNHQTWVLLAQGTRSHRQYPGALAYEKFATGRDLDLVWDAWLYWFARLGVAFLWVWTAFVTQFVWPRPDTLKWLGSVWSGLATPYWLTASCLLDASMGMAALLWPSKRLWQFQFALTTLYTVGLAIALPWSWWHPFGVLTKNLPLLATIGYLGLQEERRRR